MVRLADARRAREDRTLTPFLEEFAPDEMAAETWLISRRSPDSDRCAHRDSARIAERWNRRPQPCWCHDCPRYFSVKTHSVMHPPLLSCWIWVTTVYLMLTSLKGVSSTKLARDLGITQKSASYARPYYTITSETVDRTYTCVQSYQNDDTVIGRSFLNKQFNDLKLFIELQ